MTLTLYRTTSEAKDVNKVLTTIGTYNAEPIVPTSMTAPAVYITLPESTAGHFPGGNYAYIAEWNRYYYMDAPVWLSDGVWQVQLRCDVLMSHRAGIRSQSAYVARAASEYDLSISDTAAPVYVGLQRNVTNLVSAAFTGGDSTWTTSGSVLLQPGEVVVVALNVSAYKLEGGSGWYVPDTPYLYVCLSFSEYSKLINVTKRMGADLMAGLTGLSEFTNIVADAYVLPYEPNHGGKISHVGLWTTQSPVDINSWDGIKDYAMPATCYVLSKNSLGEFFWSADITLPSSDNYKNVEPFATYTLEMYPLGCQDIDGRILAQQGNRCRLFVGCQCDPLGGDAIFHYGVGEYGVAPSISQLREMCIHPLGSTNIRTDYASINVTNSNIKITELASKLVGAGESMVSAAKGGSYGAALAGGVKEAAEWDFGVPSYSVSGTPKGALYTKGARLITTYQEQLPIPTELIGRPLYQVRTLGELSGFVQAQDVHVEGITGAFLEEVQEIERLLRSGVYM